MQSCERCDGNALSWPTASPRARAGYSLERSGAGRCPGDPVGLEGRASHETFPHGQRVAGCPAWVGDRWAIAQGRSAGGLAESEGGLQDLSGDWSGGGAAEPCADEHDRDGYLGVLGGRERHEPGVGVLGVGRVRA